MVWKITVKNLHTKNEVSWLLSGDEINNVLKEDYVKIAKVTTGIKDD